MIINKLDSIEFQLKELYDFSWIKKYGTAFWVVDQTGSGCLCIGMQDDTRKYFCKIAGANTTEAEVSPEESVRTLKNAVHLYSALEHPNLIRLVEAYDHHPFYVAVFEWADGECLFDHWNFETYQKNQTIKSPKERFWELPLSKKLEAVEVLFSFLQSVNEKGYVAVDFYDGSIMYDFVTNTTIICDIDFFRKAPVINDKGADWFGTKRLKAPEEYLEGHIIDAQTNVFTLGALLFEFFGCFSADDIKQRYCENRFIPCSLENWQLNEESYRIALKAVCPDRKKRYSTISEFWVEWKKATALF